MSGTEVLITILGGVALMLWGSRMVRTGMMRAFGSDLRHMIAVWTDNRFKAAAAGAGVATLVQSSTATALIACSFASREALATAPALAVMLGADLGSSIGAQIFTSGVSILWPVLGLSGYLLHAIYDRKNVRLKNLGRILIGLGILLLALRMIGEAARALSASDVIADVLTAVSDEPLLAILTGALLTWIAHSSLAIILLVASLAAAGVVPAEALFPIVLGINLGAAFPAVTATLAEPRSVRRIPLGNLLFRMTGVILAVLLVDYAAPYVIAIEADPVRQVVNFHLLFNLALGALFIGLIAPAAQLTERLLPDLPEASEDPTGPRHLDDGLLETPSLALGMAARETLRMGDTVEEMLVKTMRVFQTDDPKLRAEVEQADDQVDTLHEAIKLYLTRLSRDELEQEDSQRAVDIITFTTNLEHVGDIIDNNLMDLASKKAKHKLRFSEQGFAELTQMHGRLLETVRMALTVFMSQDLDTARALIARKDQFRLMELRGTEQHLERLRSGQAASVETSALHLDILRDFKRINSHLTSVAYPILEAAGELRRSRLVSQPATEAADPSSESLDVPEAIKKVP